MRRRQLFPVLVCALVVALSALCFVACGNRGYTERQKEFLEIDKPNTVLHIEHTRLTFAKDMEIDKAQSEQIIANCECILVDPDSGKQLKIEPGDLTNGTVSYDAFDLSETGRDKRIKLSFKNAENYIFYDVIDFKVNFYEDKSMTELWRSTHASVSLDMESLGLAVWVDTIANNYATDELNRAADQDKAMHFAGWYDSGDAAVTGRYGISVPQTGTEMVMNLYATFLTDKEFEGLKLSYDSRGRLVYSGYDGDKTEVVIPEGVTYIDMNAAFGGMTAESPMTYKRLHIPSTVTMNVPFISAYNTIGLESIEVDGGNPYYASYNGAMYSKDYKTLYLMPSSSKNTDFHEMLVEFDSYSCAHWQVTSLVLPESVTTLQNYCFAYSALTSVAGLDRVTQMTGVFLGTDFRSKEDGVALYTILSGSGSNEKYGLSMIIDKSVTEYTVLPGTVDIAGDAFNGCVDLTKVDLGNEVVSIGASAFSGCTLLKEIKLPSSLERLGESVFYGCASLTKVEGLPDVTFTDAADSYEHTVPSRLFYECVSLTDVTIPEGVEIIAPSAFYGCTSLSSVTLPSTLKDIGNAAFCRCGLTSIELPIGLEALGRQAFGSCEKLTEINLAECENLKALSGYLFQGAGLIEVTLPSQITEIPDRCFNVMPNLTTIDITNIKTIGTYGLAQNSKLTTVKFGEVLETIDTRAFSADNALTEVVLPDSVKTVGGYAFASCTKLTKFTLGSGVKTMGVWPMEKDKLTFGSVGPVFYLCTALKEIAVAEGNTEFTAIDGVLYGKAAGVYVYEDKASILYTVPCAYGQTSLTLPDSVRVVLPYSVHRQSKLTEVVLNEGVVNIGKGAFYGSTKLTSLTLPASVEHIGASILLSCTGIKNFTITEGNARYTSDGNLVYNGDKVDMYLGIDANVAIKQGITKIDTGVFMNNTKITSITIPDSVTTIGSMAFSGCTKLVEIKIGAGLSDLDPTAFASLSALNTITVSESNPNFKAINNVLYTRDGKKVLLVAAQNGMTDLSGLESGVTEIGDYAFSYHATLASVVLPASVRTIGAYVFYECRAVEYFYGSEVLETIGERAFSFATSIDPSNNLERRFCDTLRRVLLYGNLKSIGDNAFYGQYGIQYVFFEMTHSELMTLLGNSGSNYSMLTKGCPQGNSEGRYNEVVCCLYSAVEPTVFYDGYGWFWFNEGEPCLYNRARG